MALVDSSGFHHVRLTVTDIGRSKKFYDEVFGWPIAVSASASVNEPGVTESPEKFYGGVVYQTPQGSLFGLRPVGDCEFDSTRTGLDHIGFAVADRAALEAAQSALRTRASRTVRSSTSPTPASPSCLSRILTTSTSS